MRKTSAKKYKFKRTPYRHQVAALKMLLSTGWGGALLMEPRTGKTKVAIDYTSVMHQAGHINRVIILCPLGVMGVWVEEIEANCPFPYRITMWDKDGRKEVGLPRWGRDLIDFVIINHEALSTPGAKLASGRRSRSRGGRFMVKRAIERWQPHLIIVDESHRFKKTTARKSSMLYTLGKPVPYRLILTGTLVTKKKRIMDVYGQWKFLNPDSPIVTNFTFSEFKKYFAVWTERNGYPQWLRNNPRRMKLLRKMIHDESFAVTRDECFDLPPRTDQVIHFDLTGHGAQVYDQMAEEMVALLKSGEITEAPIKIVQMMRLAQITSGITKTTPTEEHPESRLVRVGRDKLNVFRDIISDLFEADEKIVVAARWRADIAAIAKVCDELKVKRFILRGGVDRAQRDRDRHEFNQMIGPACFIMQPAAGGLGIDLRSASIFIWYSLTNSWVDFKQAEDRVALSERKTTFMYLVAKGTVDQIIYDTALEDGDLAATVTDSPEKLLRGFKE